jgi:tRNA nucleotidyltransferase (CCA-adding enzyme)
VARYAARLGFTVEEHTRALAASADPSTVSGDRLGAELRLTLREPDPPAALEAVRDLNPAYLPEGFEPRPRALAAALDLLPDDGRPDLVTLAACTAGMDVRALLAWLSDMGFTAAERDLVAAASRAATGGPLHAAHTNAEVARAARGAPVEAVALAGGENARRWLHDLRHVRLEIDGHDLLAAGVPEGPEIGARLQRALDRKLDGEVSGREEEMAAALAG